MKIAMLAWNVYPFHGYGGFGRYVYFLSKHLARQGVGVDVFSPCYDFKTRSRKRNGVRYRFLLPLYDRRYDQVFFAFFGHLLYLNFATLIKKEEKKFALLHSFEFAALYYLTQKKRLPVINQPFGLELSKNVFKASGIKKYASLALFYPLEKYCNSRADAIASEGPSQTEELVRFLGVDREKIFILPDGVDLDIIAKYTSNVKIARKDLGLKDEDFVLINVNRLTHNKGIEYLILAIYQLRQKIKNIKLVVIGSGPEESRLKFMANKYRLKDTIIWLGEVPDHVLFSCYKLADVAVTPTLFEGLPITILEAMATGKPIVASKISDIPQVVKHGKNGFLVPPGDPQAIADAVLEIYDKNKIRNMGEISKKIVKHYDWKIIAGKAIKEYEKFV